MCRLMPRDPDRTFFSELNSCTSECLPAQDAEWFEAKQSKRKGGAQSNGMPSRQTPTEVTKEDEFEVRR